MPADEEHDSRARLTDAVLLLATTASQLRDVVQELRGVVQLVVLRMDRWDPRDPAE